MSFAGGLLAPCLLCLYYLSIGNFNLAQKIFGPLGVTVTCEGQRHLGAVVGTEEYRRKYVLEKVTKWVEDIIINQLADLALCEPQAAYSAFTKGLLHRWTYFMRTIPDIGHLFEKQEEVINDKLIPALVGRPVSTHERKILELPVRYGGLGIINPTTSAMREYNFSKEVTEQLSSLIYSQVLDVTQLNETEVTEKKIQLKKRKEEYFQQQFIILHQQANPKLKRHLDQAREKSASTWLTALPLKSLILNYVLNKQDFPRTV